MGWWKADPVPKTPQPPTPTPQSIPRPPPTETPLSPTSNSACPVDEKTRTIWLAAAQSNAKAQGLSQRFEPPLGHPPLSQSQPQPPASQTPASQPQQHPSTPLPPTTNPTTASQECSSTRISQSPTHPPTHSLPNTSRPLSTHREISSIPRAPDHPLPSSTTPNIQSTPSNSESESGHHPSGNWIYPSESQFASAVLSKQTTSSPEALLSSISHIIPIHNAVNERAWSLIKGWEADNPQNKACNGPKLHSFSGRGAGALSPRAKFNVWVMGYKPPFDRHDWVVQRCGGERVEYVIDFYEGKSGSEGNNTGRGLSGNLNFYLDVRPKLNSWEGWRMRGERWVGWR